MNYSDIELRGIVGRAMPLCERWRGGLEPDTSRGESEVEIRLERWQQAFSVEGDSELFGRRLAAEGLDLLTCETYLGSVRLGDDQPLPVWANRLNATIEHIRPGEDSTAEASSEVVTEEDSWARSISNLAESTLPFWVLWVPFVTGATQELRSRGGAAMNNLAGDSLCNFQKQLLETLAHLAAIPLNLEFCRFMVQDDPLLIFRDPAASASSLSRNLYHRFVYRLRSGGMLAFLQEYAVLARLVAVVCDLWADHVAEFCHRVEQDRRSLEEHFNQGRELGPVVHVDVGISDPHNRRRTVVISTFGSGLKVVYKPRDLGIDEAYWALIDWLNRQSERKVQVENSKSDDVPDGQAFTSEPKSENDGVSHRAYLPLRTLIVLNRTTHGWVEFVEHRSCQDTGELDRYHWRIGMHLCLAYVMGATDLHYENLIANGEQPVLVDLETMLQAPARSWDVLAASSADQQIIEVLYDSVLSTGLLPFWMLGKPGKSFDISGIGAEDRMDFGFHIVRWEDINTDRMNLVYRNREEVSDAKRPMLDGKNISASDYIRQMIDGFTAMYRLLLARRDEIIIEDGPLRWFRGRQVRNVLRATKSYAQISQRRLHPEFLRDGADGSIELERLARDFVAIHPDPQYPPPWGIYRAELQALERMDIPFFSAFTDSDALLADGGVVAPGFYSRNGLQRAVSRLRRLSEDDHLTQINLIRATLHTRFMSRPSDNTHRRAAVDYPAGHSTEKPLSRAELIAAAVTIAEDIRGAAIRGNDGGITWISLTLDPTTERMNLLPMGDNLLDGRIGVALFLAALEHIIGQSCFRDLALAAVRPLRSSLRAPIPPITGPYTLGGGLGLGGQLYALVRIAGFLGDDELLDLAGRVAHWFIPKRIAQDETLDIIGGAAGGTLGLLALWATVGNSDALNRAVQCGEHLLKKRTYTETGHRAWPGNSATPASMGFAHGAEGIAYALLRLSQATGESRFLEAAVEAREHAEAMVAVRLRNLPNPRVRDSRGDWTIVSWCRGAAGVGMGRLGGLPVLDTQRVQESIANALVTTRATRLTTGDHLCCGNLGLVDFFVEASQRLGRPELLEEAHLRGSEIVRRAARTGGYRLFARAPGCLDSLAFFQGITGIGYELLRLADPDRVPCALLWQ